MTNDLNDHFSRPLALLACGGFKDNRDNRDNPLSMLKSKYFDHYF